MPCICGSKRRRSAWIKQALRMYVECTSITFHTTLLVLHLTHAVVLLYKTTFSAGWVFSISYMYRTPRLLCSFLHSVCFTTNHSSSCSSPVSGLACCRPTRWTRYCCFSSCASGFARRRWFRWLWSRLRSLCSRQPGSFCIRSGEVKKERRVHERSHTSQIDGPFPQVARSAPTVADGAFFGAWRAHFVFRVLALDMVWRIGVVVPGLGYGLIYFLGLFWRLGFTDFLLWGPNALIYSLLSPWGICAGRYMHTYLNFLDGPI